MNGRLLIDEPIKVVELSSAEQQLLKDYKFDSMAF